MSIHAQTKAALAGVRTHTKDLGNQAAQMKLQSARMDESIERLNVAAAIYFTLGQEDRYNAVYSALTDLDALANGFPQVLREGTVINDHLGKRLLTGPAKQVGFAQLQGSRGRLGALTVVGHGKLLELGTEGLVALQHLLQSGIGIQCPERRRK